MRVHVPVDLAITLSGGAAWIAAEALKPMLAPSSCRWCDPGILDSSARDALRWNNCSIANTTSYVTGFALAPIAAFGVDAVAVYSSGGSTAEWGEDALVIMESIVIAADINQLVKFAVGRERPFVHALSEDAKGRTGQPSDNNVSFYSGHTTLAFSAAVSSGMIASLKGYSSAPYIWAFGLVNASATGYLRIAADRHYLSDVLIGAATGIAVGVLVPWIHRPSPVPNNHNTTIAGSGLGWVGFSGVWF
ncbi:MAG: phosphatase PAP2 family protein [Polyangiaceae bacterium]|nr:phosphatase PAP2 family protein [Polyangiaceae bacterium]